MAQKPLSDALCQEAVNAYLANGRNKQHAADALGIPRNTFKNRIEVAMRRGIVTSEQQQEALHGWSPDHDMTHVVPKPFVVRGHSTLYKDGKVALQWVKTKLSDKLLEDGLRAAVEALAETIPRAIPVASPTMCISQLCNQYTFTDTHIGMHAWDKQTGADWDLLIAERTLKSAFDYLISASAPAQTGIILNLGDLIHFDSLTPVTPTNGHILDADSRYSKVVKVAIRVLRYLVDKALTRHERIIVVMAEGNHDPASSVWLRHLFGLLYENESRVSIVDNETPYIVHQHGKTMLCYHHGHLAKKDALPILFAAQYPAIWGITTKRYCHTGHYHHSDEKEHSGMIVKQHPTLAARDAYAARGGWISERRIEAITYHSEYGEVGTITCTPEMLV